MLTELGFKRMRYADFLPLIEQQARELFGSDIDLEVNSPMGQFVQLQAYGRAEENELAEDIWNSFQVEKATGVSLDAAVKIALLERIQRMKAKGRIKIIVNGNVTIPAGSIVGTKDQINFVTLIAVLANAPGEYYVDIESIEFGLIGNVPPNTITEIVTPVAGWVSVTNTELTTGGQERESDAKLKERYFNGGLSKQGSSTTPSIRAALLDEVPGVRAAITLENDTGETNADGIPEHSTYSIVLGGDPKDIAQKIFEKKAGGIRAHGSTTVDIIDDMGEVHTIGFDYAVEKPIYANVTIKTSSLFPSNGDDLVKLEVVKYIGGNDAENNVYSGLSMGQTVVQSRTENAVFRIDGVDDVIVTLSTDGVTFSESNITTSKAEVAQISIGNVVVVHA